MMKLSLFMVLFLNIFGIWQVKSQDKNIWNPHESIPLDTAVRYGKLDNGFTYYLLKNNNPENTILLKLVVKAGRMHEDEDQLEYAHLLEHLIAESTRNFPDIKTYIKEVGGYIRAGTESRYTIYSINIPSGDDKILQSAIQIIKEWAYGNHYDPELIAVQRQAVEGEMRTVNPSSRKINNLIEREVLNNISYTTYSDNEIRESLRNFDLNSFERFYKKWYRPHMEAAIIVGDINTDSLETEIKDVFSDSYAPKKQENINAKPFPLINLSEENHFSTVDDSISSKVVLKIVHSISNFGQRPNKPVDFKKMLVQQLYIKMVDTKAKQLKQQFYPPFESFSTNYGLNQFPDLQLQASLMSIDLGNGDLPSQKSKFQNGLLAWKQIADNFSKDQLENAKREIYEKFVPDDFSTSILSNRLLNHFVYGKAAPGIKEEVDMLMEIISDIDLDDIVEYGNKYENLSKNTSYVFFRGRDTNVPRKELIKQWIREVETMVIDPIKEVTPISTLKDAAAIPTSDDSIHFLASENSIGVTTIQLENGVKLLFKPTKPRTSNFKNKISLQAFRSNIIPLDNRKNYLAGILAPEVMEYMGAGPYDKFELDRFKKENGIALRFHTTENNQMIYGSAKNKDFPELFNLLYLYINQPRKDSKGFEAWRSEMEAGLQGKAIRGSEDFIIEKINSVWYPELPRLEKEDLNDLGMDTILKSLGNWFSGIENFTFIITGDFNENEMIPLVVKTLSAFPVGSSKNKKVKPKVKSFDFPLRQMEKRLEYKNIDQVYTNIYFPVVVPRDLKTKIELQVLTRALYKHVFDRLRNGCYTPSATGEWMDYNRGIFAFHIQFDSAPGREKIMREYAMDAFRSLLENGIDDQFLKTAISEELRRYERRFNSFGYFNLWPDYLQSKLENNEDPVPGILSYGTLLEYFITPEDVNSAAKKFMKEEFIQVFLGYSEGYDKRL